MKFRRGSGVIALKSSMFPVLPTAGLPTELVRAGPGGIGFPTMNVLGTQSTDVSVTVTIPLPESVLNKPMTSALAGAAIASVSNPPQRILFKFMSLLLQSLAPTTKAVTVLQPAERQPGLQVSA